MDKDRQTKQIVYASLIPIHLKKNSIKTLHAVMHVGISYLSKVQITSLEVHVSAPIMHEVTHKLNRIISTKEAEV